MHYVTEDELREAYGACPFEKYELPEGARLTPSARQFLIDFRIEFEDDEQGPRPRGDRCTPTNPRPVSRQDLVNLYRDAYNG